jgi:hypothetical protein
MERDHHFEAAGLNFQEVELLDVGSDGAAADLLDYAYSMIWIDHLVAYVEVTVATDHAGRSGQTRNFSILVQLGTKINCWEWQPKLPKLHSSII